MVQSNHPFSDNDPTFEGFVICIDEWNTTDKTLHTQLTLRQWWAAVRLINASDHVQTGRCP